MDILVPRPSGSSFVPLVSVAGGKNIYLYAAYPAGSIELGVPGMQAEQESDVLSSDRTSEACPRANGEVCRARRCFQTPCGIDELGRDRCQLRPGRRHPVFNHL